MLPEEIPRYSQILPLFFELPLNTGAYGDQAAYHVQHWPGCPHLTTAQSPTRF